MQSDLKKNTLKNNNINIVDIKIKYDVVIDCHQND